MLSHASWNLGTSSPLRGLNASTIAAITSGIAAISPEMISGRASTNPTTNSTAPAIRAGSPSVRAITIALIISVLLL